MVGIIDYGVGNVNAFQNIYKKSNIKSKIVSCKNEIYKCNKLILPGVGHFNYAMNQLNNSGFKKTLDEMVIKNKIPVLGICVGMQMMARFSEEGNINGLGWLSADVKKINIKKLNHKPLLPHMGWNDLNVLANSKIISSKKQQLFYFLHSYYVDCDNENEIIATSNYGHEFAAIVNKDNIFGIQCHPEKSHEDGITFLQNFSKL